MAMKLGELRKLSDTELEQKYDEEAQHVVASLNYLWNEITRREQNKQTKWIIFLTIVMVVATVISTVGIFVK
ncbi:MAG: hypothetical protein HYX79_09055 [Chloroflexi bacterium]|nr:hypothetical protein [Chloroflexota bacterium]